jgi:hypothetical protein
VLRHIQFRRVDNVGFELSRLPLHVAAEIDDPLKLDEGEQADAVLPCSTDQRVRGALPSIDDVEAEGGIVRSVLVEHLSAKPLDLLVTIPMLADPDREQVGHGAIGGGDTEILDARTRVTDRFDGAVRVPEPAYLRYAREEILPARTRPALAALLDLRLHAPGRRWRRCGQAEGAMNGIERCPVLAVPSVARIGAARVTEPALLLGIVAEGPAFDTVRPEADRLALIRYFRGACVRCERGAAGGQHR